VDVSREKLTERFRALTDEELLRHLQSDTLTALASEIATAELRSRGIDPQPAHVQSDREARRPPDGAQTDLVTVAEFWDPLQANLLRACLESHGLFAFVWGEHLGTGYAFLSVAGGGSRVQVREDQVAQAKEVIQALERGELEIPDAPQDQPR
jgi:hypothetical protein